MPHGPEQTWFKVTRKSYHIKEKPGEEPGQSTHICATAPMLKRVAIFWIRLTLQILDFMHVSNPKPEDMY